MTGHKKLVCVQAALGITEGQLFPVTAENGSTWEVLLAGEYRKVNKRSCRVQGWKDGPRFGLNGESKELEVMAQHNSLTKECKNEEERSDHYTLRIPAKLNSHSDQREHLKP